MRVRRVAGILFVFWMFFLRQAQSGGFPRS